MHSDPIADMLTRIRNAARAAKSETLVPHSRLKMVIAELLKREGYLADVERLDEPRPTIKITLKYDGRASCITEIRRVSTPGHRWYVGKDAIPVVRNNYGIAVLSTSKGIMTNKEAKKSGVGGEVLCTIF